MIAKAIITKLDDGYTTIEYRMADGMWMCRHSSYDYKDLDRYLCYMREEFGEFEIEGDYAFNTGKTGSDG